MIFPDKPRVKFHNNPLIEVICQIHLVKDLSDEFGKPELLIRLHDSVRVLLPLLHKRVVADLHINADTQQVTKIEKNSYEFSTFDGSTKVVFDGVSVSCATSKYESKEDFFRVIFDFFDSLNRMGLTTLSSRVGLRFKDVFERSKLGSEFTKLEWRELVNSSLIGVLSDNHLIPHIQSVQNHFSISLQNGAFIQTMYGLAKNANTDEQVFLLDSDCYKEGIFEYAYVKQFLYEANIHSRNFFCWAITERLYNALRPEPISE